MTRSVNVFSMPLEKLQEYSRGEKLKASKMNETIRAVNELRGVSPGHQKHQRPKGGAGGGTNVSYCRILAATAADDIFQIQLHTRNADGTTEATGDPFEARTRPGWLGMSYAPFIGTDDTLLAYFIDGAWVIDWAIRLTPIHPPAGLATGSCP